MGCDTTFSPPGKIGIFKEEGEICQAFGTPGRHDIGAQHGEISSIELKPKKRRAFKHNKRKRLNRVRPYYFANAGLPPPPAPVAIDQILDGPPVEVKN